MIEVNYIDLSSDNETPLMQLREVSSNRSVHVAVSDYDANRLALYNFKVLKITTDGIAESFIKAIKATIVEVQFYLQNSKMVQCKIALFHKGETVTFEARPGEAVLLALRFEAPIVVEEGLFYAKSDGITLKERLRAMSTTEFGHTLFH